MIFISGGGRIALAMKTNDLSFYNCLSMAAPLTVVFATELSRKPQTEQLKFAKQFVVATNAQLKQIDRLPQSQCTEWGNLVRACLEKVYLIECAIEHNNVTFEVYYAIGFLEAVTKHHAPLLL